MHSVLQTSTHPPAPAFTRAFCNSGTQQWYLFLRDTYGLCYGCILSTVLISLLESTWKRLPASVVCIDISCRECLSTLKYQTMDQLDDLTAVISAELNMADHELEGTEKETSFKKKFRNLSKTDRKNAKKSSKMMQVVSRQIGVQISNEPNEVNSKS